ncbi:hypothetical protein DKX38_019392 [Salix brachista]|uniref:Lipoxygenase domain-containing protein n=1 Tax=Salix brachista TaxID=2182728 RepID=A0A5N5KG37_9ROSI|nr:hypothetical protein DKX38_019392 [Salix brachista]
MFLDEEGLDAKDDLDSVRQIFFMPFLQKALGSLCHVLEEEADDHESYDSNQNPPLEPHFRDTVNINALARQTLINTGGILESTVYPANYAMEMSSLIYKNWDFTEQAFHEDLKKR